MAVSPASSELLGTGTNGVDKHVSHQGRKRDTYCNTIYMTTVSMEHVQAF